MDKNHHGPSIDHNIWIKPRTAYVKMTYKYQSKPGFPKQLPRNDAMVTMMAKNVSMAMRVFERPSGSWLDAAEL